MNSLGSEYLVESGAMDYPKGREEKTRLSLLLARSKVDIGDIAEALGCRRQTLSPFLKGAKPSDALLDSAERWAKQQGFWIWDTQPDKSQQRWERAAADLENLVGILRSDLYNDGTKAKRFTETISFHQSLIETFASGGKSEKK